MTRLRSEVIQMEVMERTHVRWMKACWKAWTKSTDERQGNMFEKVIMRRFETGTLTKVPGSGEKAPMRDEPETEAKETPQNQAHEMNELLKIQSKLVKSDQEMGTPSPAVYEAMKARTSSAKKPYFRILLEELGFEQTRPTEINVDNTAARQVAMEPVLSSEMKHVRRRHYFARQMQEVGEIVVNWVDTKFNWADALTKALPAARHRELTSQFARLHNASDRARPDAVAALAMIGEHRT